MKLRLGIRRFGNLSRSALEPRWRAFFLQPRQPETPLRFHFSHSSPSHTQGSNLAGLGGSEHTWALLSWKRPAPQHWGFGAHGAQPQPQTAALGGARRDSSPGGAAGARLVAAQRLQWRCRGQTRRRRRWWRVPTILAGRRLRAAPPQPVSRSPTCGRAPRGRCNCPRALHAALHWLPCPPASLPPWASCLGLRLVSALPRLPPRRMVPNPKSQTLNPVALADALRGGCTQLEDVCFDQGQLILYSPRYWPSHQPSERVGREWGWY